MFIDIGLNRNSSLVILLRESCLNNGKVKEITLANPSCLNSEFIEFIKRHPKSKSFTSIRKTFQTIDYKQHSVILLVVVAAMKKLNLVSIISSHPPRGRDLDLTVVRLSFLVFQNKLATTAALWQITLLVELKYRRC
ncbi:MAG: hypothetical protein LBV77_00930 [Candidatus Adiutrix intracellularis]|nr:hypothetical protein [Candidatus Adiutrix intracellularis]